MKTLQQAFESGMEYCAKHCLRYGNILSDESGEYHKGYWRKYVIDIQGERVMIMKENGVTTLAAFI